MKKKFVWVPAPLDLLVRCLEKVNQTYSPKWWWFLWWFTMAQPVKNNKSKLLIFHGAMCNSRPPELYSEFSGGNGTEPIDEIWNLHFFVVNFEGGTRKITMTASFKGKNIWKISLNTTQEKKRLIRPKISWSQTRSQPKCEDQPLPFFTHSNFLITAQFVPFSWMVFFVGLLNPPKKRPTHTGFQPCGSWIPNGPGGVVNPLRGWPTLEACFNTLVDE